MGTAFSASLSSIEQQQFDEVISVFQGDLSAAAARLSVDPRLRLEYSRRIKEMAADLTSRANRGFITWQQAAREAQETRNLIMEMIISRSTPLGRAMAEQIKSSGKTLNELVAKKATSLFGQQISFAALTEAQKKPGICRYCRVLGQIESQSQSEDAAAFARRQRPDRSLGCPVCLRNLHR